MQKVSKELLGAVQKGVVQLPQIDTSKIAQWDLTTLDSLLKLFQLRENHLIQELGNSLAEGLGKGKSLFDIWMKEQSDVIQACAKAYGERIVLEQFISNVQSADLTLRPILTKLCQLYSLWTIQQELTFFLVSQILTPALGHKVSQLVSEFVKEINPSVLDLVNSFGIVTYAPIANDWVKYNETDNQGELILQSRL